MYYHVRISEKDKRHGEVKPNLSEEELKLRFINPYEQGDPIVVNGRTIKLDNLERIQISSSKEHLQHFINIIKYENHNSGIAILGGPSYEWKAAGRATDVTDSYIYSAPGCRNKQISRSTENVADEKQMSNKKVFIVHGHNNELKLNLSNHLRKLGLEPIILHEQVSKGQTIIEKIEEHSDVLGAIVLFTADDKGNVKTEETMNLRARQNVVFEAGLFVGKLGRDKVILLKEKEVEFPNDLSGIVYIDIDDVNRWHMDIIKELKSIGYKMDFNNYF